jgi:SAM-dependent methyltransferase
MNDSNPGGSLGDVYAPDFKSLSELKAFAELHAGNLYTNYWTFAEIVSGQAVADMGCGYGYLAATLSDSVSSLDGYDVDPVAIAFATKRVAPLCKGSVRFLEFDGVRTPAETGTYGVVLSFEVIEHTRAPESYLAECARILEDGATLCLSTPNGLIARKDERIVKLHSRSHLTEFYPSELEGLLENAGFRVARWMLKTNTRSDEFRRPYAGWARRSKNKLVGRLKSHELMYAGTRAMASLAARCGHFADDPATSYQITESSMETIDASNCDAILVEAHKIRGAPQRAESNQRHT